MAMLQGLALLAVLCLIFDCGAALSIQPYRRVHHHRSSVTVAASAASPITSRNPLPAHLHGGTSDELMGKPFHASFRRMIRNVRSVAFGGRVIDDRCTKKNNIAITEAQQHHLIHSIALVATCRRLCFLFLSIAMVKFVRSVVLNVSVNHLSVKSTIMEKTVPSSTSLISHFIVGTILYCFRYQQRKR